jgi:adenylate cyclase
VANALELLYADRLDEHAGVLSHHWERANERIPAARWAARAAAWAGQSHPADALRHWRRVRELLGGAEDPETAGLALGACLWILQFGWRLGIDDREVADVSRQALALAEGSDSEWAMAAVLGANGLCRGMVGNVREALHSSEAAVRYADRSGDVNLRLSVGSGYWLTVIGRAAEALADLEWNIEKADGDMDAGREILGFSASIWATLFRSMPLTDLGRLDEAAEALAEGVRLAELHNDPESLGWAHSTLGGLSLLVGEPGDGLEHARKGLEIAGRLGSSISHVIGYNTLASAQLVREEWDDAAASIEEELRVIHESRTGLQYESWALVTLSVAELARGNREAARAAADEGVRIAAKQGVILQEAAARRQLGRVLAPERPTEARAELEHALELCEVEGPGLVPGIRLAMAELAEAHGRDEARDRQLAEALRLFEAQGATGHVRRVREMLDGAPVRA